MFLTTTMHDNATIKLFLIEANNEDSLNSESLAAPQRIRALKLSGKRRLEYSLGRLVLRYALKESGYHKHRIIENEQGGPSLELSDQHIRDTYTEPKFSISHSKGWVGVAYCESSAAFNPILKLGLDIEKIKDDLDVARGSYFCNEAQIQVAHTLAPNEVPTYFTRLWTHKEAYCKSQGLSVLSNQSKAIDFSRDNRMRSGLLDNTHYLSIYSSTEFVLETYFLNICDNGKIQNSKNARDSSDLTVRTANSLNWESSVSSR